MKKVLVAQKMSYFFRHFSPFRRQKGCGSAREPELHLCPSRRGADGEPLFCLEEALVLDFQKLFSFTFLTVT
jgi:hypothetical protein